ncbi:unnamed protein product [Caenorhabditis auriculariae]|uniref:Uncharacterized protein n=1 Tax=Caenorhabditis auriculariae TaxID=2777116 RepID=A0A8S1H1Q3_9PELO|nr:unnamed protein product [Caenorhabditis auriculariae]
MENNVKVNVLFFGKARELAECDCKKTSLPKNVKYEKLKELIFQEVVPELQSIEKACILAVDQRYVDQKRGFDPDEFQ